MVAFNKFEIVSEHLAKGVHDLTDTTGDTLKVALTNTEPTVATDDMLADITQIANSNGYTTGGEDAGNGLSRTGEVTSITAGTDVVWTASGGSIGPFQHVVLYNDTATNDELIGYWSAAGPITLSASDTFTVNFGTNLFTIT